MRLKGYVCLAAFCAGLSIAAGAAAQEAGPFRVPGPEGIFNISPSPSGSDVLFYAYAGMQADFATGNLYRLKLDGTQTEAVRVNAPAPSKAPEQGSASLAAEEEAEAFNPARPVWQADGRVAYFKTDKGIFRLNMTGGQPELVAPEEATVPEMAGLALSPDGRRLAFWRTGKPGESTDALVLWDIQKQAEVRRWDVLRGDYGSERQDWSIFFTADGLALYARTYDQDIVVTSLYRFDMDNSGIAQVTSHLGWTAQSKDGIYDIDALDAGHNALHKLGADGALSIINNVFPFQYIYQTPHPHWLVVGRSHTEKEKALQEFAVLDTETGAVKPVGVHYDVNILPDGRLLLVDGTELRIAAPGGEGQK